MTNCWRDYRVACQLAALLLALCVLLLLPGRGHADEASGPAGDQYCGRLAEIELALSRDFDEHLIAVAHASGDVVRLYVSASRRSWTLLAIAAVRPDWACIVGGGTDFDVIRPAPGDAVS